MSRSRYQWVLRKVFVRCDCWNVEIKVHSQNYGCRECVVLFFFTPELISCPCFHYILVCKNGWMSEAWLFTKAFTILYMSVLRSIVLPPLLMKIFMMRLRQKYSQMRSSRYI